MKEIEPFLENIFSIAPFVLGSFGIAFLITHLAIPSIVTVAQIKGLYDVPNGRTSHTTPTPVLGGIAIFAGLVISTIIFSVLGFGSELKYIIAGLIILFFFGIKDDILALDPKKKLAAQIIAGLLIAVLGDVRITHFHGFLGIDEVSYVFSLVCTIFFFIVMINGFNLIDGIDGLASGVGIITSVTFGCWFAMSGYDSYAVMSFALTGSLVAFFYFNVFGKRNKIFLGDTGSLILGLSVAVFAVRFMEYEGGATGILIVESAPAVTFGILIVPLFDTLRVFSLRIFQKRSPFIADKQHIHHRLLELGFPHLKATLIILFINQMFIGLSIALQQIGSLNLIIIQLLLASVLSYIMMKMVRRKYRKEYPGKRLNGIPHPLFTGKGAKHINPENCPSEVPCPFGYGKELKIECIEHLSNPPKAVDQDK